MNSSREEYKRLYKIVKNIFFANWKFFISFILLYTAIGQLLILPSLKNLIDFSLHKAGYEFIDTTILFNWLTKPFTIPILFLCLLILGSYVMFEMSSFVLYIDYARKGIKVSFKEFLTESIKRTARILIPRNWSFLILIILVFPFTLLSFNFSIIFNIEIPEFIVDFLKSNTLLSIIYLMAIIILNILSLILIFSVPAFIIDLQSFKESMKTSKKLIMKNFKYIVSNYIIGMGLISIASLVIFIIFLFIIILFAKIFHSSANSTAAFTEYYIIFRIYSFFLFSICIIVFNFIFITSIYLNLKGYKFHSTTKEKVSIQGKVLIVVTTIIALLMIGIYLDYVKGSPIYFNRGDLNKIVAHRAGATLGPENTLSALDNAINEDAYSAEIDVQETKDGNLVILHDTNLKRISGLDKNIWDLNYNDIKTLDVGSYFSEKYKNEKIPTLSEMIKQANSKINLMIEIKKNSHNEGIEKKVVDEIKAHNFEKQCSVASMDLDSLKIIKELAPEINTVYISSGIYGNYYSLKEVDAFSIEASFVNSETVTLVHNYNKKIYVWTVNKEENLNEVLQLKVDGIVTDNVVLANYLKNRGFKDPLLEKLLETFFN